VVGAALFIVLEREVNGIDAGAVSGKSLSRHLEWLDDVARKRGVRSLSQYISVNPEEAAGFLEDEGVDTAALSLPSEQWFDAVEGMQTIGALLDHAQSQKPGESGLLQDLKACQHVLEAARDNNVRFHFAVDF
jgi:hypothetical protein